MKPQPGKPVAFNSGLRCSIGTVAYGLCPSTPGLYEGPQAGDFAGLVAGMPHAGQATGGLSLGVPWWLTS